MLISRSESPREDTVPARAQKQTEAQFENQERPFRVVPPAPSEAVSPEQVQTLLETLAASRQIEQALHLRVRQQAGVAELGRLALAGEPLGTLCIRAVEFLRDCLDTDYTVLTELLPEGDALIVRAISGWGPELLGRKMNASVQTQAGFCLARGEPIIMEDLSRETRFAGHAFFHDYGVVSGLSVPIAGRQRLFGTLCAHTRSKRVFTQDDVNFIQSLANVIAAAVEHNRENAEIGMQQAAIRALSTPVLKVRDRLLILPIIGPIDVKRARQLSQQLLDGIRTARARAVVIDITGVHAIDETAANSLVRAASAARLLGAQVILTGISTEIARTLGTLPVDLRVLVTKADLQSGIEEAEAILSARSGMGG